MVSLPSFEHYMASFNGLYNKSILRPLKTAVDLFFYDNMEKTRAEFSLFSVEKARALHLTSFLLSVLL